MPKQTQGQKRMKRTFILNHQQARNRAVQAIIESPEGYVATISQQRRSGVQNALMWVLLQHLADQIDWHGQKLTAENWKDMCTAALKRQEVMPGIDGGFVVLGTSTRKMTKQEMAELIDFIYSFGAENGVDFGETETFCNEQV